MRVFCQYCGRNFSISDDKIPDSDRLKFKCPACGKKNEVALDKNKPQSGQEKPDAGADILFASDESSIEPDLFPPGANVAFMFLQDQNWEKACQKYLESSGYYISKAKKLPEALKKLSINQYQIILLEDNDDTIPILEEIAAWPGVQRRQIVVILIGDRAKSNDPKQAFYWGVNTYLSNKDQERAAQLIGNAIDEHIKYLEIWNMVKAEA